jgi:xylulokinase
MSLLGLDIGTSGCKATIIDEDGQVLSQSFSEYPLISAQPGWQEIDPERVWSSVRAVISRALAGCRRKDVRAIGASSFGEAVVAIDEAGQVLCGSMIYIDSRGTEEAEYLRGRLGDGKVLSIAGTTIQPMYSLCKILWLKNNRPEIYRKTWKFLLFADYILFRLGASPATDYSLAARTMAFDITRKAWSPEILAGAGIDMDKFAEPVQSGTPVGHLSAGMSGEFGLPPDVLLAAGGHDQPCAALGAGVIRPGLAVDGLGTTECITPSFGRPVLTQEMAASSFACVPHVIPDQYVTYAFTFTSGSILKWFRDNFGTAYKAEAEQKGINVYDLMISKAAPGLSSVLVLPHFAGAATPYMDTRAQGAFIGLSINTRPEDIIKGILEGITFEIMINVAHLSAAGISISELTAVGGLARSDTFLQLKADMMGVQVTSLHNAEAGTTGVAILAGTACGTYGSIEEAVSRLVRKKTVFYPDERMHAQYQERFRTYQKLYPAICSLR